VKQIYQKTTVPLRLLFSVLGLLNLLSPYFSSAFLCSASAEEPHFQEAPLLEAQEIVFRGEARGRLHEPAEEETIESTVRRVFSLQELDCSGNVRLKCGELEKRLRSAGALELWNLSLKELGFPLSGGSSSVQRFLKRDPWIESSSIEVKPFSRTGKLTIQEAIPWFVTELRNQSWIVSRRGALLQELQSIQDPELTVEVSQLPRVRGVEYRGADSVMREAERIKICANLLATIAEGGRVPFEVENYELMEDRSLAITPFDASLPTVFFSAESAEEARGKLKMLKDLLADVSSRGERVTKVDLRIPGRAIVVK